MTDVDVYSARDVYQVKYICKYNVSIAGYDTFISYQPILHLEFVCHVHPTAHQDIKERVDELEKQVNQLLSTVTELSNNKPKCCTIM